MSEPYPIASDLYEQYWDTYLLSCRAEGSHPTYKDFLTWTDENVPEEDVYED